jgi:hypothetical protein
MRGTVARPTQQQNGGVAAEVGDENPVGILKVHQSPLVGAGYEGMATVHVSVKDARIDEEFRSGMNAKLVVDVAWQTQRGGGEATIDAQHGCVFTIGGVDSIEVSARLEKAIFADDFVGAVVKRVEAVVHWMTSVNPKSARYTFPGITLLAATASEWIRVPPQAESMLVFSDTPASLATLLAEFAMADSGASVLYRTVNPNANGTILDGADFVRFTGDAQIVFPSFQLWL